MTFNPYFKSVEDDSLGAEFAAFVVKFNTKTIEYTSNFGTSTTPPTFSIIRASLDSIETLRDPFGEGLTIGTSERLFLPVGKYWIDGRLGMRTGSTTTNQNVGLSFGLGGYIDSLSQERWLQVQGISYLEEQVNRYTRRNLQAYYESTSSNSYIRLYHRRSPSSWPAGANPQANRDGSSDFSTATKYPYGAFRVLVLRME